MSTEAMRLGQHFRARREELELSQIEVALAGGPSNTKQTEIENGRLAMLTNQMARKIDRGLKWEPGSARRVWRGGEPVALLPGVEPQHSALLRRIVEASDELDENKRAKILRIIDSA